MGQNITKLDIYSQHTNEKHDRSKCELQCWQCNVYIYIYVCNIFISMENIRHMMTSLNNNALVDIFSVTKNISQPLSSLPCFEIIVFEKFETSNDLKYQASHMISLQSVPVSHSWPSDLKWILSQHKNNCISFDWLMFVTKVHHCNTFVIDGLFKKFST